METPAPYTRRNPAPFVRTRPTKITVPEHVGPAVKLLFTEMRRLRITYDEVEELSGVKRACQKAWRHKNRPGLDSIEAALSVVGYEFVPLPTARILPPEIVEAMKPLSDRLRLAMPDVVRLMAEQAFRDHHLESIRDTDTPEAI